MPPPCLTCTSAGLLFHHCCTHTQVQTSAAGSGYTEAYILTVCGQLVTFHTADSKQAFSIRPGAATAASCMMCGGLWCLLASGLSHRHKYKQTLIDVADKDSNAAEGILGARPP